MHKEGVDVGVGLLLAVWREGQGPWEHTGHPWSATGAPECTVCRGTDLAAHPTLFPHCTCVECSTTTHQQLQLFLCEAQFLHGGCQVVRAARHRQPLGGGPGRWARPPLMDADLCLRPLHAFNRPKKQETPVARGQGGLGWLKKAQRQICGATAMISCLDGRHKCRQGVQDGNFVLPAHLPSCATACPLAPSSCLRALCTAIDHLQASEDSFLPPFLFGHRLRFNQ